MVLCTYLLTAAISTVAGPLTLLYDIFYQAKLLPANAIFVKKNKRRDLHDGENLCLILIPNFVRPFMALFLFFWLFFFEGTSSFNHYEPQKNILCTERKWINALKETL